MEEWKENKKYPGIIVSDCGNVRNWRNHRIHPQRRNGKDYIVWAAPDGSGIKTIVLDKLVAETFVENPFGFKYIRHRNGIKIDCRAVNLAWTNTRDTKESETYSKRTAKYDKDKMPPLKELNDEGVIRLFNGICDLAIEDIAKGQKSKKIEDAMNAAEAIDFFRHGIGEYLHLDEEAVEEAVKKRVEEVKKGKRKVKKKKQPNPEMDYKKRCEKCQYRTYFPGIDEADARRKQTLACGYILYTGKRRGCHGSVCDKYVKGPQLQMKNGFSSIAFGHNYDEKR